jgi:predicted dehydrogenase
VVTAVRWPRPGATELVQQPAPVPGRCDVLVDVCLSVSNPGTERARYLQLPNASIGFPHIPGLGSVGTVRDSVAGLRRGRLVAVRSGPHQSVVAVRPDRVHPVPDGTHLVDAAMWQICLISMHGLGMGGYRAGEPITVIGAGLIGTAVRRVAIARGTSACLVVARSRAKRWAAGEAATEFVQEWRSTSTLPRTSLVVDATGTAAGLATAVSAAADGGRVVVLGSPRVARQPVSLSEIHQRGLRLVGAHIDTLADLAEVTGIDVMAEYSREYFELVAGGGLSFADAVTTFSPEQAPIMYRQLVGDATLVGAAVAWRPPPSDSAGTQSVATGRRRQDAPVGIALVGCGDIGVENAAAIRRTSRATLAGCFDTRHGLATALAAEAGTRAAASLGELVDDPEVEAVLVATPHDTHEAIASAVLRAGRHLLLQKPLSADLPAACRITALARESQCISGVLFPARFTNGYRTACRALGDGSLGRPVGLLARYLVDKPASYYRGGYSGRSESTWRLSKARSGGGVLIMNMLHHLDVARSLLAAEADSVYAITVPSRQSAEIEDVAAVVVGFGEVVASFSGAATVPGMAVDEVRIWGESGQCAVLPKWDFTARDGPDGTVPMKPEPDDPQAAAIDDFARAVRAGRPPAVSIADALALQAVVAAAYESAATGTRVSPRDLLERTSP